MVAFLVYKKSLRYSGYNGNVAPFVPEPEREKHRTFSCIILPTYFGWLLNMKITFTWGQTAIGTTYDIFRNREKK